MLHAIGCHPEAAVIQDGLEANMIHHLNFAYLLKREDRERVSARKRVVLVQSASVEKQASRICVHGAFKAHSRRISNRMFLGLRFHGRRSHTSNENKMS